MKLYFDTCCYNRPYDDQSQTRIRNESGIILGITRTRGLYGYVVYGSAALDKEINRIKNKDKLQNVSHFYRQTATIRADYNEGVFKYIKPLAERAGVRGLDVLHLCFSVAAGVDYLLTVDDRFLEAASGLKLSVKVINPLNFPLGGVI